MKNNSLSVVAILCFTFGNAPQLAATPLEILQTCLQTFPSVSSMSAGNGPTVWIKIAHMGTESDPAQFEVYLEKISASKEVSRQTLYWKPIPFINTDETPYDYNQRIGALHRGLLQTFAYTVTGRVANNRDPLNNEAIQDGISFYSQSEVNAFKKEMTDSMLRTRLEAEEYAKKK